LGVQSVAATDEVVFQNAPKCDEATNQERRDSPFAAPLVKLVPHRIPKRNPLGVWKGKVIIKGDIISPIEVAWDPLK